MMLFEPFQLSGMKLKNRLVCTSTVTRLNTEDGYVTGEMIKRHARIARGGVGMFITDCVAVTPSRSINLRIHDDRFIDGLRRLSDAIHAAGGNIKVGIQLGHFLKISRSGWRQKVEELSKEEIKEIYEQHIAGAKRALQCGFDCIEWDWETHMTIAQFLSPKNKRTDEYGGTLENRMRLMLEIYEGTRDIVGPDYVLGARINAEDLVIGGTTLLHSTQTSFELARRGIDYISVECGGQWDDTIPWWPDKIPIPTLGYSGQRAYPLASDLDAVNVYQSEVIRKALRKRGYRTPLITAGKIPTPEVAEEILQEGKADLIGMARPFICDPDWPKKYLEGREDDIVRCCYCGNCLDFDGVFETVICARWPKDAIHPPDPFLLVSPCRAACPAGIHVQDYVQAVAKGDYKKAYSLIRKKIPLPGVIARVCTHPCETECNRGQIDEPIAINALKRFVTEHVSKMGKQKIVPAPRTKDEKVAIIGSGPAGLTVAHDLVTMGYGVTMFEKLPVPGGMMAVGIPGYRLPKKILQTEIKAIQRLGAEIKLNSPVGENGLTLDDLWKQGYRAIFVAVGAHSSMKLGVPGEDLHGVTYGVAFLRDVNMGKKVRPGQKVVIVGGGNVAIDAARTALRLGSKEVSIVYRRSREEMPASDDQIEAAEDEGIKIHYLAAPVRILGKGGKVVGMQCIRTELGKPDASGRKEPIPVKGSEFLIDADMVIPAVGEAPDLAFLPRGKFEVTPEGKLNVMPENLATSVPGVFAGGDAVTGPATVIDAIAAGKKGATFIDRYLRGESMVCYKESPKIIRNEDEEVEDVKKQSRQHMPTLPISERIHGFKEVELGLAETMALSEARRCLDCGTHPKKRIPIFKHGEAPALPSEVRKL
jgi:NADPH-dependent glutamate synthase beta subunit-like oxidoreductase/2,4-dienoyl-CoA reductase-like NADH-dependent reductase (Old Yellow Enzyme family)